jgi:endo-1,4-beta-xylanase
MYDDLNSIKESTKEKIDTYRKTDLEFEIKHKVNGKWKPLQNKDVTIKQTDHNFLFGINLSGITTENDIDIYTKNIFNYGTVCTFWPVLESVPGYWNFDYVNLITDWCNENNIEMKVHPLIYNLKDVLPEWNKNPSMNDWERILKNIVNEVSDKIHIWEVVNEFVHFPIQDIAAPYFWMKELCPNDKLAVNEFGSIFGLCPEYLNTLKAANQTVPFDIVGLQCHCPDNHLFDYDLMEKEINKFSCLSQEKHITEISFHSDENIPVYDSEDYECWNDELQAQELEKTYRILFSNPNIEAITYWGLKDGDPWRPSIGLISKEGRYKKSSDVIKNLIKDEWWIYSLSSTTNVNGIVSFNVFKGQYDIYVDGKLKSSYNTNVYNDNEKPIVIKIY